MTQPVDRCTDVVMAAMVHLSGAPGPFAIDVGEWERRPGVVAATIDAPSGRVYRVTVEDLGQLERQAA